MLTSQTDSRMKVLEHPV